MRNLSYKIDYLNSIIGCLDRYNLPFEIKKFIACQFALEHDFGSLVEDNNHSGMKVPLVRFSVALNAGNGNDRWASYRSLQDCVDDYMLALQYHRPLRSDYSSVENFSKFIKFYCPDRNYISNIMAIYNQFVKL